MGSSARFILSNADLGNTPTIVLVIYLIILFGLGVLGYIKSKGTEEDYYLAGRGQGLLVTSLTIMATFFQESPYWAFQEWFTKTGYLQCSLH